MDILVSYVTGQQFRLEGISIDTLLAPFVDKRLLPWKDLFSNSTLFPINAILGTETDYEATNDDIVKFLDQALETLPQFKEAKVAWRNGDKDNTIKCFQKLKTSNVMSWVKCAEKILVKLDNSNNDNPSNQNSEEITTEIQSLCKSTNFFNALVSDKKPSFELSFSGTLHCEACLVSLIAETSLASEDISAWMKVSQVSDLFLSSESHFL